RTSCCRCATSARNHSSSCARSCKSTASCPRAKLELESALESHRTAPVTAPATSKIRTRNRVLEIHHHAPPSRDAKAQPPDRTPTRPHSQLDDGSDPPRAFADDGAKGC